MDTPRPMTHDLIRDLLDALGADVIRVVITELATSTYFAEIVLQSRERRSGLVPAFGHGGRGRADRQPRCS